MTGTAREGLAQSVQTRLLRHARTIGADPNFVLTRYAAERFLYRLSRSPHAERFVLKGALLMLAWLGETLRPTRDADLLGFGDLGDAELARTLREVCATPVEADAMAFDADAIVVEPIRLDDAYGGRRAVVPATLGAARLRVQVDIGIGDAVTPAPEWLEYPGLLDLPRPRLRAYPRETVVAEKLHAIALLGLRNSRLKDYFDLYALAKEGALDRRHLVAAIAATFERRQLVVPDSLPSGLSEAFGTDRDKNTQWAAFLDRNRLDAPSLVDVVTTLREAFVHPLSEARLREREG